MSLSDQFWVGSDWRNMMIDCGVQRQLANQLRTTHTLPLTVEQSG